LRTDPKRRRRPLAFGDPVPYPSAARKGAAGWPVVLVHRQIMTRRGARDYCVVRADVVDQEDVQVTAVVAPPCSARHLDCGEPSLAVTDRRKWHGRGTRPLSPAQLLPGSRTKGKIPEPPGSR
jgi:hypothetical protein